MERLRQALAPRTVEADTGPRLFEAVKGNGNKVKIPRNIGDYYRWYRADGVVFASVNALAESASGQGFFTRPEDESEDAVKAKELCDELGYVYNFDSLLPNICKNMLIAGFCPVETQITKYPSKSMLKIVSPLTVVPDSVKLNSDGSIQSITQKTRDSVGNEKPVIIDGDQLSWFVNNQLGNDICGISIIQPVVDLLSTKQTTISNMDAIIDHYISPSIIWKSTRKIGSIKEAVQNKQAGQDLYLGELTPDEMKDIAQVVEVDPRVKFWEYISYIDRLIYIGLYAPNLYYWRDATEASGTVLRDMVDRNIYAIQRNMKRGVEAGFYSRLTKANNIPVELSPRLDWGVEKVGVEDLNMETIVTTGLTLGYVTPSQYLYLLKSKGLDLQADTESGDGEDEEPEDVAVEKKTKKKKRTKK